ncbi:hypothetical protein KC362_g41 [Hortaea werneckii]|nr:hypothetical protein KC362_g41 [Hortaea werneckii]
MAAPVVAAAAAAAVVVAMPGERWCLESEVLDWRMRHNSHQSLDWDSMRGTLPGRIALAEIVAVPVAASGSRRILRYLRIAVSGGGRYMVCVALPCRWQCRLTT